ncbi:MAG: N-acetylmuramoyl-L-alanine amidase [Opitutae bacterium]|nr:N-acetylmuramoyl-L-alanine amidase [Opitutae bacterium]
MARLPATRSVALMVLMVWLPACASAQPAPPAASAPLRAPPTRPAAAPAQLWPVTRLRGTDCVSVRDIAERFGLKAAWSRPELAMTLSDKSGVRFTFETRQRDFYFDGLRIFLGEPPLLEKDTLWLTKLDVIKLIAPLFRPVEHLALLPAAPRTIVLDPGHGGSDPGKENQTVGAQEKTLTLDVALRLKKLLEAQGWRVVMTRTTDTKLAAEQALDLQRRADVANKAKADLFLSIHFNSVERDAARVTGVETYTMAPQFMLSTASDQPDEMTRVAFPGNRQDYANLLLGAELHRALLAGLKTPDRGFKRGRLAVLRFIECPGALVECGYLSSNAEARRLVTPEFRQKIAEGLAAGLQGYAATLAALQPKPAPSAVTPTPAPTSR